VAEGGAEASLGLLGQGVDHCFFTGSPAVGRAVMAAAAPHLTPVTLELGGKCPAIVTSSARVDVAARRIAFGKLVNSGQTCVAPDYVLVDRRVRDELVGELASALARFSGGRSVPVVNPRHAARLAGLLRAAGGRVTLGGAVDVDAALAQPTVVVDPDPESPILSEEIFGPVLPVLTVDSLDQAIARVTRGGRPLASYLFSEERRDERRLLRSVISGGTVVNHVLMHLSVNDLPFGGVGTSGMGRYHGRWGFETLSNARAVLRKPSRPDFPAFYPPYNGLVKRIVGRLL
jgi:aldehyde dehydrogenase (NAD+)